MTDHKLVPGQWVVENDLLTEALSEELAQRTHGRQASFLPVKSTKDPTMKIETGLFDFTVT